MFSWFLCEKDHTSTKTTTRRPHHTYQTPPALFAEIHNNNHLVHRTNGVVPRGVDLYPGPECGSGAMTLIDGPVHQASPTNIEIVRYDYSKICLIYLLKTGICRFIYTFNIELLVFQWISFQPNTACYLCFEFRVRYINICCLFTYLSVNVCTLNVN